MKYQRSAYCPNCHFPLPYKAKFCAQCGQKANDGKITMSILLKQLWIRIFHLEGKLLRSAQDVFIPGKLTVEFFKGRQKRYPAPIQFLFIVMFFFLLAFNHFVGTQGFQVQTSKSGVNLNQEVKTPEKKINLYELGKKYTEIRMLHRQFDSLPAEYRTPVARQALDTLLRRRYGDALFEWEDVITHHRDTSLKVDPDSLPFSLMFRQVKVATDDIFQLEPEAIAQKYHIDSWIERVLIQQGIKTIKDPQALVKAYLGSLIWTILALIGLLSGLLVLMYWRQRRFYVEHFIFLLHQHTAMFLILTLAILINHFISIHLAGWVLLLLWLALSPLLAMWRYYGQGFGITFLKWSLFSLLYVIGFGLLFSAGMLVVFILF